jgi:hypothetical protein
MDEVRLGVDVGRTRTTAVVLDAAGGLLGRAEAPALAAALAAVAGRAAPQVALDAGAIAAEALERRRLRRVAAIRIGAPFTLAVPPFADWPRALREAVSAGAVVVAGGAEHLGGAAPLDERAIARFLERADPESVALTGVFAPVAPAQELAAAELVRRTLGPAVPVSLSHEIGSLGLLERENATILNAALAGVLDGLARTVRDALGTVDAYLACGDGTLMALDQAQRLPLATVGSGPASALRGAFRLTSVGDAVVAVAEGSALVVGALRNGLARESSRPTVIAGLRAGLRSCDIRVAVDRAGLEEAVKALAADDARRAVLIAVAGASERILEVPAGIGEVIRPRDGALAVAIGAALGTVGGEASSICPDRPDARRAALREARAAASARAVQRGADPARVAIVDIEEAPYAAPPEPAIRIRVRAAGPP